MDMLESPQTLSHTHSQPSPAQHNTFGYNFRFSFASFPSTIYGLFECLAIFFLLSSSHSRPVRRFPIVIVVVIIVGEFLSRFFAGVFVCRCCCCCDFVGFFLLFTISLGRNFSVILSPPFTLFSFWGQFTVSLK